MQKAVASTNTTPDVGRDVLVGPLKKEVPVPSPDISTTPILADIDIQVGLGSVLYLLYVAVRFNVQS